MMFAEQRGEEGAYSCVPCFSHLTIDHEPLSRRSSQARGGGGAKYSTCTATDEFVTYSNPRVNESYVCGRLQQEI